MKTGHRYKTLTRFLWGVVSWGWLAGCTFTTSPQFGEQGAADGGPDLSVSDARPFDGPIDTDEQLPKLDMGSDVMDPPADRVSVRWQGALRASGARLDLGQIEQHESTMGLALTLLNGTQSDVRIRIVGIPEGILLLEAEPEFTISTGAQVEVRLALDSNRARVLVDEVVSIELGSSEIQDFELSVSGRVRAYVRDVAEPNPMFRDALERIRQSANLVGLTAAIVQGRDIIAIEGVGEADLEDGVTINPRSTLFRWASVSKSLAGVVALRHPDEVGLDVSISDYLPGYEVPSLYLQGRCRALECASVVPDEQRLITLRQLLTHRAGIQHYRNGVFDPTPPPEEVNDPTINTGIEWAVSYFSQNPLIALPGTQTEYSSFGYNLAGVVLEHALAGDYESLVLGNIAHRLGMSTMQADRSWVDLPNRASGYRWVDGQLTRDPDDDVSWKLPGGGFTSTIVDLARYCGGLTDDILLPQAIRDDPLWAPSAPEEAYGFGFVIDQRQGQRYLHHTGLQRKAATNLRLYPEEDLCIVMMTNTVYGAPDDLGRRVEFAWRNPGGCTERSPIALEGRELRVGLTPPDVPVAYRELEESGYRIIDIDAYEAVDGLRFNLVAQENVPGPHLILAGMSADELLMNQAERQGDGLRLTQVESYLTDDGARYIAIWREGAVGQSIHVNLDAPQVEQLRSQGEVNLRSLSAINVDGTIRYTAIDDPTAPATTLHIAEPRARYLEVIGGARRQGLAARRIDWVKTGNGADVFVAELTAEERPGGLLGPMACDELVNTAQEADAADRTITRIASLEVDGETLYSLGWETP